MFYKSFKTLGDFSMTEIKKKENSLERQKINPKLVTKDKENFNSGLLSKLS